MKIRVLFGTNYGANDTTSFLRGWGPFSLMRDKVEIVEPKLTYRSPKKDEPQSEAMILDMQAGWWNDWRNFRGVDVCFLHRPYGILGGAIVNACKLHGVPLWVDHDDDLLAIPDVNPHKKIHSDSEKLFPGYDYSIREADILTCSGKVMHKELQEKYGRKDAILITTGLDDSLLRFKKPFVPSKKVAWRGSTSHMSDLEHFKEPMAKIAEKHPDLEWFFAGIDPRKIWGEKMPFNGEFSPPRNQFMFLTELCNFNAAIHLVPLEDNKFNRVKSNLSWLDATLAGSAVIGPAFEEWMMPRAFFYDGIAIDEAFEALDMSTAEEIHNMSWEYIKENLLTSKLNKQRYEILENL